MPFVSGSRFAPSRSMDQTCKHEDCFCEVPAGREGEHCSEYCEHHGVAARHERHDCACGHEGCRPACSADG